MQEPEQIAPSMPGTLNTDQQPPVPPQPFPRLPALKKTKNKQKPKTTPKISLIYAIVSLHWAPRPDLSPSPCARIRPVREQSSSADNNISRSGTGKAVPWQTQALRQAELSIRARSLKRLIKDKKKQTKEKRELMDMS